MALVDDSGDFLEYLSEKDLEDILMVAKPESALELSQEKPNSKIVTIAKRVDKFFDKAEKLDYNLTIYKPIEGDEVDGLRNGGQFQFKPFFIGTKKKPPMPEKGLLLAIKIPEGTPIIQFPGQAFLLKRGLVLDLEKIKANIVRGTINPDAMVATGGIELTLTEFHMPGVHDQESHGDWAPEAGPMGNNPLLSEEENENIRKAGHNPLEYDGKGKPISGTAAWRDAHGIDAEVAGTRPLVRYKGPNDPAIERFYGELPPNQKTFAKKIAGQEDGIIMNRKAVPGAEEKFGKVTPQIRPDNRVLLDNRQLVKKERELQNAKIRKEEVDKFTSEDLIKERQQKLNESKRNVEELKSFTPEEIREASRQRKEIADVNLTKAIKSKDPVKIAAAEEEVKAADWHGKGERRRARLLEEDPGRAISLAEQEVRIRESALSRAKADPEATLKGVREYSAAQIPRKEAQLEGVRVKYVFPPGKGSAARIEANSDAQNIKNLTQGKGKVYFVMEGNIKSDSVLSQVKKEDPKAAVISVPSVSTWPDAETDFVASKYLKGRDVILIPDADGVKNPAVVQQAKKLRGKLMSNGVENVVLAAPPVLTNKKGGFSIETLTLPSGAKDERKGVDDHIGLGKGTLGDLVYNDSPAPRFDTSELSKQYKKNINSVPNSNKTINAISDMVGDRGIGRVSHKSIESYSGLSPSSVNDSVGRLESMGVIKVHHVFDPKLLGHGRRVPTMEEGEIKRLSRRAGVPLPDIHKTYVSDDDNHEVAPIIEITNRSFVSKAGPPRTLASKYSGLKTSSGAPKPIATQPVGIAGRPGIRIVRTPEGARRYGVAIGQPIPEAEEASLQSPLHIQFHMLGQHDQLTHAPVSSQGGGIPLAKIAAALGATALAVGLVYAYNKAPGSVTVGRAARRSRKLEGIVQRGGEELDAEIALRKAYIKEGIDVERNTRDLEVLNGGFLHDDDAAGFISSMNKSKYTKEELDGVWDYAGYKVITNPAGKKQVSKNPSTIHRILRGEAADSEFTPARKQIVARVDKALKRNPLPRDVTLYRGASFDPEFIDALKGASPGTVMREQGYSYTGLTEARALRYTNRLDKTSGHRPVLFVIRAKAGTPAMYSPAGTAMAGRSVPIPDPRTGAPVVTLPRAPILGHFNKGEILLPREQGFKIISSSERADGVLEVIVETVD